MANNSQTTNLSLWIKNTIKDFCRTSPDNSLNSENKEPLTDEPLIGFSNGADPLTAFSKKTSAYK
jgi:epoxyqueuosine reductase